MSAKFSYVISWPLDCSWLLATLCPFSMMRIPSRQICKQQTYFLRFSSITYSSSRLLIISSSGVSLNEASLPHSMVLSPLLFIQSFIHWVKRNEYKGTRSPLCPLCRKLAQASCLTLSPRSLSSRGSCQWAIYIIFWRLFLSVWFPSIRSFSRGVWVVWSSKGWLFSLENLDYPASGTSRLGRAVVIVNNGILLQL